MTYATVSNGISPRTTNKQAQHPCNIQARTNVHILYRCCSFSSDPKAVEEGEKKRKGGNKRSKNMWGTRFITMTSLILVLLSNPRNASVDTMSLSFTIPVKLRGAPIFSYRVLHIRHPTLIFAIIWTAFSIVSSSKMVEMTGPESGYSNNKYILI